MFASLHQRYQQSLYKSNTVMKTDLNPPLAAPAAQVQRDPEIDSSATLPQLQTKTYFFQTFKNRTVKSISRTFTRLGAKRKDGSDNPAANSPLPTTSLLTKSYASPGNEKILEGHEYPRSKEWTLKKLVLSTFGRATRSNVTMGDVPSIDSSSDMKTTLLSPSSEQLPSVNAHQTPPASGFSIPFVKKASWKEEVLAGLEQALGGSDSPGWSARYHEHADQLNLQHNEVPCSIECAKLSETVELAEGREFTLFTKLPVELQDAVWELACIMPARHIHVDIGIGLRSNCSFPTPDPIFKCRTRVPGVLQASPASRSVALKVFKPCLWDNSNNSYDGRPLVYMDVEEDTLMVHYPKLAKAVCWWMEGPISSKDPQARNPDQIDDTIPFGIGQGRMALIYEATPPRWASWEQGRNPFINHLNERITMVFKKVRPGETWDVATEFACQGIWPACLSGRHRKHYSRAFGTKEILKWRFEWFMLMHVIIEDTAFKEFNHPLGER